MPYACIQNLARRRPAYINKEEQKMKRGQSKISAVVCSAAAAALLASTARGIEFAEAKTRIEKAKTPDHKAIETLMCVTAGLRSKEFVALGAAVCAEALKSEDVMTRYYAARALAGMDESALPAVMEAMADKDANVRGQALRAIGNFGGEDALPMLAEAACAVVDAGEKQIAQSSLAALPIADAEKKLIAYAANADELPEARVAVIKALVMRRATSAVPALLKAAREDPEPSVRVACLEALGELAGIDSAAAALEILKTAAEEPVPLAAADALAAIVKRAGSPEAETARTLKALDGATAEAKPAIIAALALIGGPKPIEKVDDFLSDKSALEQDKLAVYERLGKAADPEALGFLTRNLEDIQAGITDGALRPQVEAALVAAAESMSKTHSELAIAAFKTIVENADDKKLAKRAEDAMGLAWVPSF